MNRILPSVHGGALKITLTVPLTMRGSSVKQLLAVAPAQVQQK